MNPQIAAAAFVVGIAALFHLDRDPKVRHSLAIWIPMAWLSIGGSRVVSSWLDPTAQVSAATAYLEGNPTDRNVQAALLALGLLVLIQRRETVWPILRANVPILLFFLYCGISALWSDFPAVTIRRWVKAISDLVMVLVMVSDRDRSAAVRVPGRVAFLLIPLSILLMKYYPELARSFNDITGEPEFTGVATSKNGLGVACMLFGLGSVWRFLEAYREIDGQGRAGRLVAHGVVIAMAIWLFSWAQSMTSLVTFLMAVGLIVAASRPAFLRRRLIVHLVVLATVVATLLVLFAGVAAGLLQAIGRDPTLTGRTEIWKTVLGMVENPLFGTGFESFWVGERLERILSIYRGINQAHNGYIEVYLNLGWTGLFLLAIVLVTGYRNVFRVLGRDPRSDGLRLAYFFVGVVVNFTEAQFKMMSPVWVLFLLAITAVPEPVADVRVAGKATSLGFARTRVAVQRTRRVVRAVTFGLRPWSRSETPRFRWDGVAIQ